MKRKIIIITALLLVVYGNAVAADYRFTYKKGNIAVSRNNIKSGIDSVFAVSYGAAAEVRCGPGSELEINSVTKTGESVFTLKSGSCFIRIIDDGSGASVALKTPFVVLKSRGAAFYAGCAEKAASVYSGNAGISFKKSMAKLTQGRTFSEGKITENKPYDNQFKEWSVKRDKADISVNLQADKDKAAKTEKILMETLKNAYAAGNIIFSKQAGPEEISAAIKLTESQSGLSASGTVYSGLTGALGVIDLKGAAGRAGDPFESQAFLPLIYDISSVIIRSVELAEAGFIKNGRKTIIESEGLPEKEIITIEQAIRGMPGFIGLEIKKYHNTKVIFEVLQAGTGYDINEVLAEIYEKSNISIWKYSKNIVKLRVVKVEN